MSMYETLCVCIVEDCPELGAASSRMLYTAASLLEEEAYKHPGRQWVFYLSQVGEALEKDKELISSLSTPQHTSLAEELDTIIGCLQLYLLE